MLPAVITFLSKFPLEKWFSKCSPTLHVIVNSEITTQQQNSSLLDVGERNVLPVLLSWKDKGGWEEDEKARKMEGVFISHLLSQCV